MPGRAAASVSTPGRRPRPDRPKGDARARWERRLARLGYRAIAGVDEAGRGCWAGPLVAAAVILPKMSPRLVRSLRGLRDSKQLSPAQRNTFYNAVREMASGFGVGLVSAATVDLLGLSAAGRLAMERALRALACAPDYVLVDAFMLPDPGCPQEPIIFGDALCVSIAAASVIAKVERDRLLDALGARYPGFGFERNRGYGTPEHARALAELGPTPEHRFSYAPLRGILELSRPC